MKEKLKLIIPDNLKESASTISSLLLQHGYETEFILEKEYQLLNDKILKESELTRRALLSIIEDERLANMEKKLLSYSIENSQNEIYIFDAETLKFRYVNRGARENLGYSMEQLTELTPLDLKPEFTHTLFLKLIRPLKNKTLKIHHFKTVHKRADGSLYPVEVNLQYYEFEEYRVFLAVIQDITERIKAEEEIQTQHAYLDSLIDTAPEAIVILDNSDKVIRINNEFTKIFGYKQTDAVGCQINDLIVPERLKNEGLKATLDVTSGKSISFESIRKNKNGKEFWVSVLGSPIIVNNKQIAVYAIYRDISEKKLAELEIKSLNESLERKVEERTAQLIAANKELEAFAYSVSHDLRAPLRAINGYTNILLEDYNNILDDEGKHLTSVIIQSSKKMGQLIDDLLRFSRFGRAEISLQNVNMKELVSSVFYELTNEDYSKNIKFHVSKIHDVKCDLMLIKQVWINLISNAIKFTSHKTQPEITINSTKSKNEIIYTIRDNGAGFDMQYKNKLFGVFQRLHSNRDFEGNGVGLAIVNRIIKMHNGNIWAESELNNGATFYFSLPFHVDKK